MSGNSSVTPVAIRIRRAVSTTPPREADGEARLDLEHLVVDELDAVALYFVPSGGDELERRHAVSGEEALHVGCGCVARGAGIDDGDPAPRPAEDERGAEARGAAADDDDVVGGRPPVSGHPRRPIGHHAASAAISADGFSRRTRSSVCVQLGIHQFQSPISRISAGTSRARMTVASRMIPAARPIASGLTS